MHGNEATFVVLYMRFACIVDIMYHTSYDVIGHEARARGEQSGSRTRGHPSAADEAWSAAEATCPGVQAHKC